VLLGVRAAGLLAAADAVGLPAVVAAALAVGALALATRGLHLDGLADTADGLAASYDRGRALEVMRRGDVGPTGVATLVLVLLLQVAALTACATAGRGPWSVAVAVLAGRAVLPLVCVRGTPAARSGGLGAAVVGAVSRPAAAVAALTVLAAVALVSAGIGGPVLQPLAAVLAGWAAAAVLVLGCVRRLGGVTGDVLGAAVEVAVTACLVVLSAG
jgi:adenosylcobinamide-GDP ribazoletransferase